MTVHLQPACGAHVHAALDAWRQALGAVSVDTRPTTLARVNRATFATGNSSVAVLMPHDRDQVVACLRIAHHHKVPVYPVSTGRNWGYGSAVAPRDGSVLLSLARLDRIIDHDDALGFVTVEPGVTFRMLGRFLRERASRLLAPTTGSSPDTSIIGNILERGIGKGFYQDMVGRICGCEGLLADAETMRLSAGNAGPSLLGLLPQSNVAVVTALTIRLDPAPRLHQLTALYLRDMAQAADCIEAARDLLQRGDRIHLELINDYRFLMQASQFPYGEFDGSVPLPRDWVGARLGLPTQPGWIAAATIWADSDEELAARRAALTAALRHVGLMEHGEPGAVADLKDADFQGLRCAYWRKRFPMPTDPDPDRDRCGVLWIAPTLPMRGDVTAQIVARVERAMLGHGFEPGISLRADGRSIRPVIGIMFDRDEADADRRAIECWTALRDILQEQRLDQYRHGLLDAPPAWDAATQRLLRALKAAADPHGVLASGRYGLA